MATRFGIAGAQLILNQDYGNLIVLDKTEVKAIPLQETAGKLKYVDPAGEVVKNAKLMGISFGE